MGFTQILYAEYRLTYHIVKAGHLSLYNIFLCILCWSSPLLIMMARTLCTVFSGYFCLAKSCIMVCWDT